PRQRGALAGRAVGALVDAGAGGAGTGRGVVGAVVGDDADAVGGGGSLERPADALVNSPGLVVGGDNNHTAATHCSQIVVVRPGARLTLREWGAHSTGARR